MVAIKNMEMPKYCNDCDFVADSLGYCKLANEHIPNYDFFSDENEKPSFCHLIEIEERKQGEWLKSSFGGALVCSVCASHMGLRTFKFCPSCGAEMR